MSEHLSALVVHLPVSGAARAEGSEQWGVLQTVLGAAPGLGVSVRVVISLTPRVKVTRVVLVIKLGDKVRLHPQQVTPVNAGKVVMLKINSSIISIDQSGSSIPPHLLDLEGAPCAQPVHGALLQQQSDDVLGLGLKNIRFTVKSEGSIRVT